MDAKYEIIDDLGKGSFGNVYRVRSSLTDSLYAAKVMKGMQKRILIKEANIHSRLTHPNIIQVITTFEANHNFREPIIPLPSGVEGMTAVVILELCPKQTLAFYTRTSKNKATMGQISAWGSGIASGLLYLKEQGIVHRDIKSENILICDDGVKIADFGFADLLENVAQDTDSKGTPYYMPLEAFSKIYGYFTDVYALGVILYQLYTGMLPFNANDVAGLIRALKERAVTFRFANRDEDERNVVFEEILTRMLSNNSSLRPEIEEIVKHEFFYQEELDTTIMDESFDEGDMTFDDFRALKAEFGSGTSDQFYLYLANRKPDSSPLSRAVFTNMWNRI